ncbi:hypothetical protein AB0A95_18705 [Micromonospora sp. NPDC049230]|uniref:hypothetical protein n=1 Tax=unclassified Micromonospora TaxID=2617518 RepID=UPI0033E77CAC
MLRTRTIKRAVGASLAAVVASAGLAAPAFAASQPLNYGGSVGQFDNNPGNGAASWAYFSNRGGGGVGSSFLRVQFYNGSTDVIDANPGETRTKNFSQDIWLMQVCIGRFGWEHPDCSGWQG